MRTGQQFAGDQSKLERPVGGDKEVAAGLALTDITVQNAKRHGVYDAFRIIESALEPFADHLEPLG